MNSHPKSSTPAGWEHLFQTGHFPPRYQTSAEPNRTVVDWAETLPSKVSVLDLGCGVGRHTLYLGMRGLSMSGTDISPSGVFETQKSCAEHQIRFWGCVAEMTALPWDNEAFDAVLSTATVCHHRLEDIRATLAEVWRVLKPGGAFLVDFLHKGTHAYQDVLKQVSVGKVTEIEPNTFIDENTELDLLDDAFLPHHYCDESEVWDLLSGFVVLNVWEDLAPLTSEDKLPQRGYWVASVRKPFV